MSLWQVQDRFLQVTTSLGKGKFIPIELQIYEQLSDLFAIKLEVLAEDTQITADMLLHKPVTVSIHHASQPVRYFHGIVNHFFAGNLHNHHRHYVMQLTPKLGLLRYATDCRIFQHKNVIEIAKIIFAEYGITDYEIKCQDALKQRDYCVQYQENTFSFLQRILAEAGLCYFFRHTAEKHLVIIKDMQTLFPTSAERQVIFSPSPSGLEAHLNQWQHRYQMYSGKFSHTSYNFEAPTASLFAQQQQSAVLPAAANYEVYDCSKGHQLLTEGKLSAEQRFAAQQLQHNVVNGAGNYLSFSAGQRFKLTAHTCATEQGEYLLTSVHHFAHDHSGLASQEHSLSTQGYHNSFNCIPASATFHPPAVSKPHILGPQTAMVAGPQGEAIHTDRYGRIKVYFHWLRNGRKNEEQISCWLRVAQVWAGRGYGICFIPRIGQEVIVHFIDGDPDRPIVIGSVYNAEYLPPYVLPAERSRCGIKTHSMHGSSYEGNELRFEDKQGNEEIYLHAQKDFYRRIENHETTIIVKGDHSLQVAQGESFVEAKKAITLKVGANCLQITAGAVLLNGKTVLTSAN